MKWHFSLKFTRMDMQAQLYFSAVTMTSLLNVTLGLNQRVSHTVHCPVGNWIIQVLSKKTPTRSIKCLEEKLHLFQLFTCWRTDNFGGRVCKWKSLETMPADKHTRVHLTVCLRRLKQEAFGGCSVIYMFAGAVFWTSGTFFWWDFPTTKLLTF